jgi:hypothetical protein
MITVCLTSCNRPDLLERTLDSFFMCNTAEIERFIVVDDSEQIGCLKHLKEQYKQVEFYYNEKRLGMMRSVDRLYSMVDTEYIFHCEDDWEFYNGGFIEKSKIILDGFPDVFTVWLRAHNDTNGHPLEKVTQQYKRVKWGKVATGYLDTWHGYTNNPGLRRKRDMINFGDLIGDCKTNGEHLASEYYFKKGFRSVILFPESGYVKHIGSGRTA